MAVTTIEDVLKHAEDFEQMLAEYYAGLSAHTTRDGVRILTDYMSRHCVRIQQAVQHDKRGFCREFARGGIA